MNIVTIQAADTDYIFIAFLNGVTKLLGIANSLPSAIISFLLLKYLT